MTADDNNNNNCYFCNFIYSYQYFYVYVCFYFRDSWVEHALQSACVLQMLYTHNRDTTLLFWNSIRQMELQLTWLKLLTDMSPALTDLIKNDSIYVITSVYLIFIHAAGCVSAWQFKHKIHSSLFVSFNYVKTSFHTSSKLKCAVFRLIITHWTNKAPSITKSLNGLREISAGLHFNSPT